MKLNFLMLSGPVLAAALFSLGPRPASAAEPFDFRYRGESLVPLEAWAKAAGAGAAEGAVRLAAPPGARRTFSFPCRVEPNAEYLFRAEVRSRDSVVFRLGGLSMAYNDLGRWQTVAGLYRAADGPEVALETVLRPLTAGAEGAAEVRAISLVRVERPQTVARRAFDGRTALVENGRAEAVIVIPSGEGGPYRAGAEAIRAAVEKATGVALPILTDAEATEADYPRLRGEVRSKALILLGRLGNNRAFWPAYNHFLTAVDGFYPGGDGYAVHTAANVYHDGKNHLIIGGTTDEGVRRGVARFVEAVGAARVEDGTLRLPWLHEVELGGECLAFFRKEDARWEEKPESRLLPKPAPGYGNVIRWYENAMGFYWTGWPSYRKRADHYLAQMIAQGAYTHHYILEFLVRVFDMLDESGVIPPEQVRAVDGLLTQNFLDFMTVGDLRWMPTFAPPYGEIELVNRHQISPWLADYKLAEFFTDILVPEGGLGELARFRRAEKERAFDDFAAHRNNPSLPGGLLDEVYEEVNAAFFRYALDRELYAEFFGGGNARKALALERINPVTGQIAYPAGSRDSKLLLGIMVCLTQDPECHWLWKHLPQRVHPLGYFQRRYLGPVRRYNPDPSVPERLPVSWNGLQFTPNPVENAPLKADHENYYFLSLRSGFEPGDDYVAFKGYAHQAPTGTMVALASGGTLWMGAGNGGDGRFNFNTASAARTDGAEREEEAPRSLCLWSAELSTGTALRFRQRLTADVEWTRDFVRLGRGRFVVRDRFSALAAGTYALGVAWHPVGTASREGDAFVFTSRSGRLRLLLHGGGFSASATANEKEPKTSVRARLLTRLERGASAVCYSVIESAPGKEAFAPATFPGGDRLALGPEGMQTLLAWDAAALPQKAALVIRTPTETGFYGCAEGEQSFVQAGKAALPDTRPAAEPGPAEADLAIPVRDERQAWKRAWEYKGLLRPAPVGGRLLNDGTLDLGETLEIAEIRSRPVATPFFTPGELPETILAATESGQWREVQGQRAWRPGIRTGNYGEAHPEPRTDETLFTPALCARYLKTAPGSPETVRLYAASRLEARHPVRVETGDFLGTGKPQVLLVSDVFPQFPRPLRDDDRSVALLDAGGKPVFEENFAGPVQSVRLLDRDGDGKPELFVLYANGTLELYALTGERLASADLYAMHREFSQKYRQGETRQPAGGFVLPFSVGLWRPDLGGHRRIVVGRYGGFTFLNPDLSFEGVLNVSGYATPGMLAEGVGPGGEEQVVAERLRLWPIGGSGKPVVREPGGTQYWPQVYSLLQWTAEDEGSRAPLAGDPIIRFEALARFAPEGRYVLLARGSALTLYDAREKRAAYEWKSQAPIRAVAIAEEKEGHLVLLAATADSLLWRIAWAGGAERPVSFQARKFPGQINALTETPSRQAVLAAASDGLYLLDGQGRAASKIAEGDFHAVASLGEAADGALRSLVATTRKGEAVAWESSGPVSADSPQE